MLAGAGSGKTATITHKIAWLTENGVKPANIAAVTFTNKASREMRTRVRDLVKADAARAVSISTFHTLGLNILRAHGDVAGYKKNFSIFNAEDSLGLLKDLGRKAVANAEQIERAQWQISHWKNQLRTAAHALAVADTPQAQTAARLYVDYERQLRAYNALDFDDLILQPALLFAQREDVLGAWRARIQYLLVDEYQDTNGAQYALVKHLVGDRGALTVVGDDDQSIYAWRGAQPENLRLLQDDFANLKVIKLEQNYRSSGRILKAANALIAHNRHVFEKALWSDLGYGEPLRVVQARNEEHEAERVVSQLLHHQFQHRTRFGDYAILYRSNHQARPFERVLREQRIPYFISGGLSFFDYAEIKDMMAYLRLLRNTDDDNAFLRVINTPRREIGPSTLERLARFATERGMSLFAASFEPDLADHLPERNRTSLRTVAQWLGEIADAAEDEEPVGVVRRLLAESRYVEWLKDTAEDPRAAERKADNVADLVSWVERLARQNPDKALRELIADLALIGMLERDEDERGDDRVALMTLHAAKGLEFPHVFLVGMEEDTLPHRNSAGEEALEEERRLAYVGITRAQKTLAFSFAAQRRRFGETITCEPSRFLQELPPDDLAWEGAETDPAARQAHGQAHLAHLRDLLNR